MIITKEKPFSKKELEQISEEFEDYVKTVIDIEKRICSAGANRHFENEEILLKQGSEQKNLRGGGIDLRTKTVDFNSMINIRPRDNSTSNEIQDP
jgi:hypothetical protein